MTTSAERLQACLAGEAPDRIPVVLWRHFPVDDQDPRALAKATLTFQRTFQFDLVKVSPGSSFCLKDWGAVDAWRGDSEGSRAYTVHAIQKPEDWTRLTVLDPTASYLGEQVECLKILAKELDPGVPMIQTIFSPLAQAKNLVGGDRLVAHLRRYPEAVHAGLKTIAETTRLFIAKAVKTGIAGIFYAVQQAQYGLLTPQEFAEFGRAYDLPILSGVQDLWLNLLHLHGKEVMFDSVADYPIQILNWHDQETEPSLAEGQSRFPGAVCGGLQREKTLVLGNPAQVAAEARQAIAATGGRRFILGTGCVVPITAPYGNLMAARQVVEQVRV